MTTSFDSISKLSEQELLDHFTGLVVRDRRTTADLLVAIAEIDERKLWASHACSSMFTFCMERFHMSEQVTAKRLWAARTARRFPVVLELVARGELHLGAIHLLARHLTEENHERVLERARHRSSREVERLIAELAPRPDVVARIRALPGPRGNREMIGAASGVIDGPASLARAELSTNGDQADQAIDRPTEGCEGGLAGMGDRQALANHGVAAHSIDRPTPAANTRPAPKPIVPLSPRRYKIEITVDEATHDRLRTLQDLLGRSATGRDPSAIISHAIEVLLIRTLTRKAGCTDRPRPLKRATVTNAGCTGTPSRATLTDEPCTDGPRPVTRAADAGRTQPTRSIPAAVRREVWQRDGGRCCYEDAGGRRCRETSNVEFHHRKPFALGGLPAPENLELRCAAHNQYRRISTSAALSWTRGAAKSLRREHSPGNVP
jgi:5-methylcytosine-specific restriction endonuclease McrA